MVIVLNGALGVGKTETAWKLLEFFDRAAILDCDYVGWNVSPFDLKDPIAVTGAFESLFALAHFQYQHLGVCHFVVSGVFETPAQLGELTARIAPLDIPVYSYLLTAEASALEARVRARNNNVEQEVVRAAELASILQNASKGGFVGKILDTTNMSVIEVARAIWEDGTEGHAV